jgi:glycosyltransferase involved in cell wall biosynthesis
MTPGSIRFVPRRIGHHAAHSGYDRLFHYMGLEAACSAWGTRLADAVPRALAWRLFALRPQPAAAAGLRAELGAMPWLMRGSGRLCHFIYGEDTYFFTPLWKRGSNRCIATFHYPPRRLLARINPGSVRSLDGALIVGENQRAALEELLPPERIHYCPHAVDTDFFCPEVQETAAAEEPAAPLQLVCAGSLFRDHATLVAVHHGVRAAGFDVQTHVIGPDPEQLPLVTGVTGMAVHRGIDDEHLLALYRAAAVGVLPLFDATANNALLEVLACGRPLVVSKVGALSQYVAGSAVQLIEPGQTQAMIDAVCNLLADPDARRAQGQANRAHAVQHLGFEPVARRMREIYAALAA